MNKILISLFTLCSIALHANVVYYNPQTGVYRVDQYGSIQESPKNKPKMPQPNQNLHAKDKGSLTIKTLLK